MRRRGAVLTLLVALVVAGCGAGDDRNSQAGLSKFQQDALVAQLEAVRVAAAAGDVSGAEKALTAFRRAVAGYRRDRAIAAATARELRTGAARVLARVKDERSAAEPAPETAPTQTVTTPTPAPIPTAPPGRAKKEKNGKKERGEGKKGKED